MQGNVQQPLFAPASGQTDEYDLNEIFAEYFINEFDDPMNAYTSSMANYSTAFGAGAGAATTIGADGSNANDAILQKAQFASAMSSSSTSMMGVALPTGGIRTAFHTNNSATGTSPMDTATINVSSVPDPAPVIKKPKMDVDSVSQPTAISCSINDASLYSQALTNTGLLLQQPQQQQQLFLPQPPPQQQQQPQVAPQLAHVQQQQQQQQTRVALPVGVGIRLGGMGGIAPTTAQLSTRASGITTAAPFLMWGAGGSTTSSGTGVLLSSIHHSHHDILMKGGTNSDSGGAVVSVHAVAERRQRNREHAKRSRVRKKFMLESLQEEARALQRENQGLRMLVQEHVPEHAMQIISDCCSENPLFSDSVEDAMESDDGKGRADLDRADFTLMQMLAAGQKCFVLSDPKLPDNPIVFASSDFYKLTGYTSKEVLGRNCRFLQGPGTDTQAVDVIRKAIATGSDATVCLINYKADGTPFWNQFFIAALRDSDNCIVNYVGVQTQVEPETALSSLEDRVNAVLPLQTKIDKEED